MWWMWQPWLRRVLFICFSFVIVYFLPLLCNMVYFLIIVIVFHFYLMNVVFFYNTFLLIIIIIRFIVFRFQRTKYFVSLFSFSADWLVNFYFLLMNKEVPQSTRMIILMVVLWYSLSSCWRNLHSCVVMRSYRVE